VKEQQCFGNVIMRLISGITATDVHQFMAKDLFHLFQAEPVA